MIIWIRNCGLLFVLVCALPWLAYRRWTTGRYRDGLRQKLGGLAPDPKFSCQGPLIWLHGVSVGEVQLLRPLVDELRRLQPTARFALSTTTNTGMELARQLFPAEIRLFYFPLDFSWAIRRTLATLSPSLVVLGELELWPNLIDLCAARDIPVTVVNGRLSERSFRGYRRLRLLTQGMFAKLSCVATQSAAYHQRFVACGTHPERTQTCGSFKFDNVSFDRGASEVTAFRRLLGLQPEHRVWVVGSTQDPEELAACHAFQVARERFPELRLIVIPRHRERFERVAQQMSGCQLRMRRRSQLLAPISADDWDAVLVDTIGELRWWWGLAELAVVGGSFGARGGQNMLEPAAYGVNVAFGPNTSNFRDVVEMLLSADAAQRIDSLADLPTWLMQELSQPAAGVARGLRAQRLVANQQGALQRTARLLSDQLATRPPAAVQQRVA